ncbi:MAG: hypothetical protein Q9183_000060 [Haloplaca sp. 2 TL-2023]
MQLQSPRGLHYPITVTKLLKEPNDNVERFAPLFSYSYKTTVTEGNKFGDEFQVEKIFPTNFESSVNGMLQKWSIQAGAVIAHQGVDLVEIEESCSHDVQFGGMCVKCGLDMTQLTYVADQVDATRATINLVHDKTSLVVSAHEAKKIEDEAKRRLLGSKKLSLVVDLDQTVIQACVEPTIGDWKKNPENPNHEAVKDVREFQLVEDVAGTRGCWYYIKLRPGLAEFLERMSDLFELHIYTMGTRGYAQKIAQIIDPQRKYFGDRILSRDESGSLVAKNLQRLFPIDTKMVLIIDDRGDVWKWNDNLIKVTPYDFFVGIGDINSSFLPKKPGLPSNTGMVLPAKKPMNDLTNGAVGQDTAPEVNGNTQGEAVTVPSEDMGVPVAPDTSALEQLVSMGGGDDPLILQEQTTRQDETLAAQLEDRPLLKKQLQLEHEDATKANGHAPDEAGAEKPDGSVHDSDHPEKPRHHILEDHDRQLEYLERSLRLVHEKYFEQYSQPPAPQQGGRVAELRGSKRKQPLVDTSDLAAVPDVKSIMPSLKYAVLQGVFMVLSGVVPLGWDVQSSDLAMWARSFGASIENNITRKTTHLVAARNRTAKVRQALKRGKGKVKIVSPQWLIDSLAQWARQDETPYLLDIDETESSQGLEGRDENQMIMLSESEDVLSEDDSEGDDSRKEASAKSKPKLSIAVGGEDESDAEDLHLSEIEDQNSPVVGGKDEWSDINAELAEFMGPDWVDDTDPDDSDGNASVGSSKSSKSTLAPRPKRSREDDDDAQEGLRKRPAPSRLSLNAVSSTTPSDTRYDMYSSEVGNSEGKDEPDSHIRGGEGSDDDDEWAELEKELEAKDSAGDKGDAGEGGEVEPV